MMINTVNKEALVWDHTASNGIYDKEVTPTLIVL